MLSSGDDGQLVFVQNPGLRNQSVYFLTLLAPATSMHVAGLDDAIFITAPQGSFYLSDTSNNQILEVEVTGLTVGSLWACVGNWNALVSVDMSTGTVTAVVPNLNGPHGLDFLPYQLQVGHLPRPKGRPASPSGQPSR